MPYILTNGQSYITQTPTGAVKRTNNIKEAKKYNNKNDANKCKQNAPGKTKGYFISEMPSNNNNNNSNNNNNGNSVTQNSDTDNSESAKGKRKKYSKEVRELIYYNAKGRCTLCGKKITYEEMTLDHKIPLAMNGEDNVKNLACACKECNSFKGSILPEDFMNKITNIFMYQMQRKYKHNVKWNIAYKVLKDLMHKNNGKHI